MTVTITKFRRDLFQLVERAGEGETVEFTHKGIVYRVVPEKSSSKLDRLTAEKILREDLDLEKQSQALLREMEAEWEKDWSEL